jgi:uncharacterized protein
MGAVVVWSASDLKAASECEFGWLRQLDAKLGRIPAVVEPDDPTQRRAGELGTEHERRTLAAYRARHPGAVVEIDAVASSDDGALTRAAQQTIAALTDPAVSVIYQAAFAHGDFVGFADFLVRELDGAWRVQDTKLARHARVTALMQLAAYVDQLDRLSVPRADNVDLLLGDGTTSVHAVEDLLPVFGWRRTRLRALIADREIDRGADGTAIAWGDERGELRVTACGRCAICDVEATAARDVLLVAGMRTVHRERLRAAGIRTIDALADAPAAAGIRADVFASLQTQARLQLSSPAGLGQEPPSGGPAVPAYEVVLPSALSALPRRDEGDLFFDFEGDPLHTEGDGRWWGLDYLFGWCDRECTYSALWAHDFSQEKAALETFVDMVVLQRRTHPGMHIYHYAPYEPTHLLAMAARHGTREAEVDALLRAGVFVDLYPIVRRALRVGSRSYSIKKLEPLYMSGGMRTSDVQRGDDSIVRYVAARVALSEGRETESTAILRDLAEYNRDDCVSTLRLRDWLVGLARDADALPASDPPEHETPYAPSPQAEALRARAGTGDAPDAVALRLAAAAIEYYPREAKSFWSSHFERLREPISSWQDTRDVVVIESERCRVVEDWHAGPRAVRRVLELRGELAPGTRLIERSQPFVLYETPAPFPHDPAPRSLHVPRSVTVLETLADGAVVQETAVGGETWSALPVAITPAAPPRGGRQQTAIEEWSDALVRTLPVWPADPAADILRRRPPRTLDGPLRPAGADPTAAIVDGVLRLDHSYLAVQGPPGTGKTFVGSRVIAALVQEHGYRVGVVAQSHAVVEHMLDCVVAAGVPRDQVAKAPKDAAAAPAGYTPITKDGMAEFMGGQRGGFVVGGTAWDFSHSGRVARHGLDLLVIDEAGQFSLAATIAVAVCSPRLLLLGDPQQLPQVSQGTHPEPIDTSALGWVMAGEPVIRAGEGYFLARSWRMHPSVAAPVSRLSYAGELEAAPVTAQRALTGVDPGVHAVPVLHRGNAVESTEEAAAVAGIVRSLLGRPWQDATEQDGQIRRLPARPLAEQDIIVLTPYNAHQMLVERILAEAGAPGVRVGTVDRFQGQEAVIAVLTLAASSGRDAPRGLDFLLLQNRLTVAVSRAQQAAFVVYSPGLFDDLPRTPEGVARLSAFARLVGVG